ncbi:TonB-dependent receptor [Rhodanobacter sp. Si-c]|uniref:TonB-dependent receptor n=1 Tax=Rhodanobacter lycopersici TaxID=3162487 RepID=A0ABV3QIZ2_9GAMM
MASQKAAGGLGSLHVRSRIGIAVALALAYPLCATAQPRDNTGGQPAPVSTSNASAPQLKNASGTSHAQGAAVSNSSLQLPTVIVTANKRSESLQNVPMAVSVLSSTQLDRENAVSFADYATQVPGLNMISSGEGQTQLVMRGITSGTSQNNATVGTYIDDAPFGSSTIYAFGSLLTPDIDPSDLQRIEVLNGPQGTLYGSNTLGGLIKFVTTPPDTTQASGSVGVNSSSVAGGGTGFGTHAMFNIPLVADTLALRASLYDRTDPGYINNVTTGQKQVNEAKVSGARAQLLWTPSDKVSVRFSALAQNLSSDGLGNGGVDVDPATLQPIYGANDQARAADTGMFKLKYRLYDLSVNADFGWAKLVSTTSYSTQRANLNRDDSALYGPELDPLFGLTGVGYPLSVPLALNKVTQEIRLQSPEDQTWEWRVGLFYTHEHSTSTQDLLTTDYATGSPIPLPTLLDATIGPAIFSEWAGYGDLTWHATSQLSVLVGARYSSDSTSYTQTGSGLLLGGSSSFTTHGSDHPVTYLFGPSYKFNDDLMAYVRVASGFRPGGPNIGVPPGLGAPLTFGPDKLVNYELGLKSLLLDNRMSVNADVFYINWTSMQLTTARDGLSFLGNGGKATSKGAEISWRYTPLAGLVLWANGTYTDAQLAANTPPGSIVGYKGDPLPYVPKRSANVGADYDFPLGKSGWSGFVGGSISYIGARDADFNTVPAPRIRLPGYNSIDLHAGVNYGDWTLNVFVKNLANKQGISSISPETINPVGGPFEATYQTPRTVGVSASVFF